MEQLAPDSSHNYIQQSQADPKLAGPIDHFDILLP
jgi:hypothetical protein